jgi:hypothetical protein
MKTAVSEWHYIVDIVLRIQKNAKIMGGYHAIVVSIFDRMQGVQYLIGGMYNVIFGNYNFDYYGCVVIHETP